MATYKSFRELADALGVDPDHPTAAEQQKVRDWISQNPDYEAGPVTNNYLNAAPGVFNYNPTEQPPADTPEVDTSKLQIQTPDMLTPDFNAQAPLPEEQPAQEQGSSKIKMPDLSGLTDGVDSAISAWTPMAASMFGGGDASGFAAGERAKSNIYTQNAAQNQKIMQWNQQRATDERLADKVAAAQAASQWKQNANARGAEGGASVVAASNETATPDIMAQKNYQTQQMDNATKNLAEVTRNKLEANAATQNASQVDYNENYNSAQNTYASNLSQAKNTKNPEEKKPEESKEQKPEDKTPDTDVQPGGADKHGDQAPSNQESNIVEDATDKVAQEQTTESILKEAQTLTDQLNSKLKAKEFGDETNSLRDKYSALKQQYEDLGGDMLKFPNIWKPSDDTTDVSGIAGAISDVSRMN